MSLAVIYKAGLTNQLFVNRPKYLLVDELEKMNYSDQNSLLHLMENGMVSETRINKTREMLLHSSVFASANSTTKIAEPLLSRFLVVKIPDYSLLKNSWVYRYITTEKRKNGRNDCYSDLLNGFGKNLKIEISEICYKNWKTSKEHP